MQWLEKGKNKNIKVCIPLLNLKTGNLRKYHFSFSFKRKQLHKHRNAEQNTVVWQFNSHLLPNLVEKHVIVLQSLPKGKLTSQEDQSGLMCNLHNS